FRIRVFRTLIIGHTLQPDLTPVRGDTPWTKQPPCRVRTATIDALEDDAGIPEMHHPAGLLVDDPFDTRSDTTTLAAIDGHFLIDIQAPVAVARIERLHDFRLAADLYDLPDFKIEALIGCR